MAEQQQDLDEDHEQEQQEDENQDLLDYPCNLCTRSSENLSKALKHSSYHKNYRFVCPKCGFLFKLIKIYESHFTAQHLAFNHGKHRKNQKRKADAPIVATTDVLDVIGVAHVIINLDLRKMTEDYVHRIGRTGRAGSTGQSRQTTSFYTDRDMYQEWNLAWIGKNKVAPLEADEIEMLLGYPRDHTRGTNQTDRYKSLGNSFQTTEEDYVHRIGRTGGAGSTGQTTSSFYTDRDMYREWNLAWIGKKKVAPLEADETKMLLGYPRYHTRGTNQTNRYKSLGNSFQVDTVAFHLPVLKSTFPTGITVLSLFSGIGGAEVVLHRLGIPLKNVVSVEISELNRNILRSWWEQTDQKGILIHIEDVQKLTADKLEQLIKTVGGFDLIIGGGSFSWH